MWPILFRDAGSIVRKSYALIESRLFSVSKAYLKHGSEERERDRRLRRTNEEWRQRQNANLRKHLRRLRETDPYFDKKERERHRERYATNSQFKLSKLIQAWAGHDRYAWIFEELPWKTHRRVHYTTPVQHRCESCGLTKPSLRSVWQSIAQPDSYRCNACYMKQEPEAIMPEGYEDIRGMKALVARKKELDELNFKAS